MASVNKAIILGNLGQDPELRYTPNGTAVCTLSVATTDVRNDPNGARQERTEWHRVIVWSKSAENCAKYLSKGRSVYIEGRIQTRSWDDQQSGQKRYSTEIIAQTVQFIGSGRDQGSSNNQNTSFGGPSNQQQNPMDEQNYGGPDTSGLDDIPF